MADDESSFRDANGGPLEGHSALDQGRRLGGSCGPVMKTGETPAQQWWMRQVEKS